MKLWTDNERKHVTKHPTCVETGECRPRHQGGKNTRHWCKGREGIPHVWEWLPVYRRNYYLSRYRLNRVTEEPICFGCGKIGYRRRSYCGKCGEPWPTIEYRLVGRWTAHWGYNVKPCVYCGAAYDERCR